MADTVGKFAQEQIGPKVREMDETETMDPALVEQLFEQGLMGIEIPEEYGGAGMNFTAAIVAIEELARVDPSVSVMVDVHNTLVNTIVLKYATEQAKKTWLPRLATETLGSFALSEPVSGSDAFAMQTKAEKTDDGYRINGSKMWITNAMESGFYIVFANLDPSKGYRGITAFIVERNTPGFSIAKKEKKLGIRASSTCVLNLDDVVVPKENLLGEEGQGYKIAISILNEGRIGIGAQMTGLSLGAWENAAKYVEDRPNSFHLKLNKANNPTTATSGTTAANSANSSAPSKACNTSSRKHTPKSPPPEPSSTTPLARRKSAKTSSRTRPWPSCTRRRSPAAWPDPPSSGWAAWASSERVSPRRCSVIVRSELSTRGRVTFSCRLLRRICRRLTRNRLVGDELPLNCWFGIYEFYERSTHPRRCGMIRDNRIDPSEMPVSEHSDISIFLYSMCE